MTKQKKKNMTKQKIYSIKLLQKNKKTKKQKNIK